MKFSFHPDAERELLESIEYYEKIENGLGFDFAIEVHSAIDRIKLYPLGWPIVKEDVRRCLINRFPFGILYSLEQNSIIVLAIMHLRKKPGYWTDRIGSS